jgi:uncharacterized protein with HEPN domain
VKDNERRDRFLVDQMLSQTEVLATIARDGKTALASAATSRYAAEHATELLAEAAEKSSHAFKSDNPGVSWGELRELRRGPAHPSDVASERVNVDQLWLFASSDAPRIVRRLRSAKFPPDDDPLRRA